MVGCIPGYADPTYQKNNTFLDKALLWLNGFNRSKFGQTGLKGSRSSIDGN